MAVFSVDIADADVNRVLNAVAANYNRPLLVANPDYDASAVIPNPDYDDTVVEDPIDNPATLPDPDQVEFIDNPETIPQFVNRVVRQFLAEHVQAYEIQQAKNAAAEAVDSTVDISDPQI